VAIKSWMVKAIRITRPVIIAATMSFLVATITNLGANAGELGAPG
jgi:hypothetical protein